MDGLVVLFFVVFIFTNLYLFYFHNTEKILASFIILGIFPYLYCLVTKTSLGVDQPFTIDFNLRFIKYLIVNLPSIYLIYYITYFKSIKNKLLGSFILSLSFISNILWTLFYGFGDTINRQLVSTHAVLMCIVLAFRLRTLRANKKLGFEVKDGFLHSNLVRWKFLIVYTIWNILFVDAEFGVYQLRIWHNLIPFAFLGVLAYKVARLTWKDIGEMYLAIRALCLALWMSAYSYYRLFFKNRYFLLKVFLLI